jgi:hypothetical protein
MQERARVHLLSDRARSLFHTGDNSAFSEIFSFYDETELVGFDGICHLKLGIYNVAESLFRQELGLQSSQRGPDHMRTTTLEYGRLALAQLGQANVTDAVDTGQVVLSGSADGMVSTRTFKVIHGLATGLKPYYSLRPVQTFLKELQNSSSGIGA